MAFERRHRNQRGMTLLELLVVMTILALVTSLLMQGFGTALSTYERVQRRQSEGMPLELGYRWFSETLAGTQAELDAPRHFSGDAQRLGGVTHQPLQGNNGRVSFFSWQLSEAETGELKLSYSQPNGIDWEIVRWPAGSRGRFIYRAPNGSAAERWPLPSDNAMQTADDGSIPDAIALEVTPADGPTLRWYANLPGRTYPRLDYRDF
ncbi:type II secretion system protein [Pseudomonadaceae bacterium SI-3]|uniref:type II secretion system protein n=1 Tax=Stutzerimonas sp. R75 TaxID=3439498 RepID=UPI000FDABEB9|nr:prepilin-type cleavage/methylation domain-containing protein [Pseudomonadaceae bacterium SI-3]